MFKYLSLAALLIASATFVSCSNDTLEEEIPSKGKFTMTINATKGGETRMLSIDDSGAKNVLNAAWEVGDEVSVFNSSDEFLGTLKAQTAGSSTTFSGTLTGTIQTDDVLTLKYNSPSYAAQDGTLAGISANCDYATADITVFEIDGNKITATDANFTNQQAIVKFTLTDGGSGSDHLNASQLTFSDGTNSYVVTSSPSTDVIYVAIPGFASNTVSLFANVGSDVYGYAKSGVTFANGQYYEITMKMSKAEVGKYFGANGKIYNDAGEAESAGTTAVAMIAYVGTQAGVCDYGLAIALEDIETYNMTYAQALGEYGMPKWATNHPVPCGTWRLPSFKDWQYMVWGYYNEDPVSAPVGGEVKTVLGGTYFWTSISVDADNAKLFYYDGSNYGSFSNEPKANNWNVRACLAF